MLLKLAWRNIWRNKRRTLITAASVFFAVFLAATMKCIQVGAWNNMMDNVVNYYFGFVQVHANGFWDDRSIDNMMVYDPTQIKEASSEHIVDVVPRIESFALASVKEQTKGVLVVGIDNQKENNLTGLADRITEGRMFEEEGLLVGEGIKEILDINLGDTIVLISQGYHGANAANQYPVVGVVHFASPELNKQLVIMPLKAAQHFYAAEGNQVTSLVMNIQDKENVPSVVATLKSSLPQDEYEVMDWQEMMPELLQAKALDEAGGNIMLFILYLIISFGIFGTILMMTKDRQYEFGVLLSVGMRRIKLIGMLWLEILFISMLGALAGILVSMPLIKYFENNPITFSGKMAEAYEGFGLEPIIPPEFDISIFLFQAFAVLVITSILALYPAYSISKMKPVEAMKG